MIIGVNGKFRDLVGEGIISPPPRPPPSRGRESASSTRRERDSLRAPAENPNHRRQLPVRQRAGEQRLDATDDLSLVIAAEQVDAVPIGVAAVPVFVQFLAHAEGGHGQVVG
jgi:hypothetical protein